MNKNCIVLLLMFVAWSISAGFDDSASYTPFKKKLALRAVNNQTMYSTFKVFYANSESLALIEAQSVFLLRPDELLIQQHELLCLKCVKGSFLPIYIQDEGRASGVVPKGFHGPFYLSMWLNYPSVQDDQKQFVRYIIPDESKAVEFAVLIDSEGKCRILAIENMELLP